MGRRREGVLVSYRIVSKFLGSCHFKVPALSCDLPLLEGPHDILRGMNNRIRLYVQRCSVYSPG